MEQREKGIFHELDDIMADILGKIHIALDAHQKFIEDIVESLKVFEKRIKYLEQARIVGGDASGREVKFYHVESTEADLEKNLDPGQMGFAFDTNRMVYVKKDRTVLKYYHPDSLKKVIEEEKKE